MEVTQRADIRLHGIPSRAEINAMLLAPSATDVPLYWARQLSKARDMLEETERSPDRFAQLMASAIAIEKKLLEWISANRASEGSKGVQIDAP
jgi:hypothetical protein